MIGDDLVDGFAASDAMIEAGGELLHTMFAEAGDLDRHSYRHAADRVFQAMMEVRMHDLLATPTGAEVRRT